MWRSHTFESLGESDVISVSRWLGLFILVWTAWLGLGIWLPVPSERVYLLVPPLLFGEVRLCFGSRGVAWLRKRLHWDLLILAGMTFLAKRGLRKLRPRDYWTFVAEPPARAPVR